MSGLMKKIKTKNCDDYFFCLVGFTVDPIPLEHWSSRSKHPSAPLWVGDYFWNSSGGVTLTHNLSLTGTAN